MGLLISDTTESQHGVVTKATSFMVKFFCNSHYTFHMSHLDLMIWVFHVHEHIFSDCPLQTSDMRALCKENICLCHDRIKLRSIRDIAHFRSLL
jgi:hypothetical protein